MFLYTVNRSNTVLPDNFERQLEYIMICTIIFTITNSAIRKIIVHKVSITEPIYRIFCCITRAVTRRAKSGPRSAEYFTHNFIHQKMVDKLKYVQKLN